jgi:hypothetical protein
MVEQILIADPELVVLSNDPDQVKQTIKTMKRKLSLVMRACIDLIKD